MALKKICETLSLETTSWTKIELGSDLNSFYLIGVKELKGESDTIDPKDVKIINFEVGIECGITNKYLTIGTLTLDFDAFTSRDKDLNSNTAMARYLNHPSVFYIKPLDIVTYSGAKYTEGTTTIGVNINSLKLF